MTSDTLPRFVPQPGGFGRRATPVASAPASASPQAQQSTWSLASTGASAQFRRAENPSVQEPPHAPAPTTPAATPGVTPGVTAGVTPGVTPGASGDVATRVTDWLMRELRDDRGLHCESLLTAAGALTGYAIQQSLWETLIKPGKMAITQVFRVMETGAGEAFFYGEALDNMLVSIDPKHQSLWRAISTAGVATGGEHLPEVASILRHCDATMGTPQFGLPRLPDDHLPAMPPRGALNRLWPGARLFLALSDPEIWPQHMAQVTHRLMHAMRETIAADLALKIVMEAAVPMSRVDPTTVPNA